MYEWEGSGRGEAIRTYLMKKKTLYSLKQNKTKNCTEMSIHSSSHTDTNGSVEGNPEGLTVGLQSAYPKNLGRYFWKC